MQHHAAYKLDIVVHHVPRYGLSGGIPRIVPKSLVSGYLDIGTGGGKFPVQRTGGHFQRGVFHKTAGSFLYHGKRSRKYFLEYVLGYFIHVVLEAVGFIEQFFYFFQTRLFVVMLGIVMLLLLSVRSLNRSRSHAF